MAKKKTLMSELMEERMKKEGMKSDKDYKMEKMEMKKMKKGKKK